MNKYNPHIHHRRSIRLKGYDYTQAGLYFITICCHDRQFLFGEVSEHTMILNDAGRMVEKWYRELENKFPDIKCREMIVMPNHFHCIIENTGAARRGRPACLPPYSQARPYNPLNNVATKNGEQPIDAINRNDNLPDNGPGEDNGGGERAAGGECGEHEMGKHSRGEHTMGEHVGGEHVGSPLRGVVQWFKTMTTNEYIRGVKNLGWPRFNGKLWQRNYYEHIIRNEKSYRTISEYIINNPAKWQDDKYYSQS